MISAREWAESYAGYAYSTVVVEAIQKDAFEHAKDVMIAALTKELGNLIEQKVNDIFQYISKSIK